MDDQDEPIDDGWWEMVEAQDRQHEEEYGGE